MKQIKIYFEDFWTPFDIHNNFIIDLLKTEYNVVIDKNPDYLFFSVFGYNHLKYRNCIKIFYSGENIESDFNSCDYAIANSHWDIGDRYFRYPTWATMIDVYGSDLWEQMMNRKIDKEKLLNRKFCNFVYSNKKAADPIRELFFKELSKYKKVDSGGSFLNNIGGPVSNKMQFIKDYKFTIAFENSSLSGYTTEKIIQPMAACSIPVYWGDPDIYKDFNTDAFINVNDFASIDDAIKEIIRLDNDDDEYIRKLHNPLIGDEEEKGYFQLKQKLFLFLKNIFEQDYAKAKRTSAYGYVQVYRQKQEAMGRLFSNRITRFVVKVFI
jgi:hypothetical protein